MDTISIADALFSKVAQRVLATLYSHPDRTFYTQEIIRLVDSGSGAVHRELAKFKAAGLITVRAIGNQKHYQANRDNPVFAELHGLIIKTFGVADVLRLTLSPLANQIAWALVYGSVARGTETAASDIDLLLVSDTLSLSTLLDALMPAESQLGRPIHPTLYTASEFRAKRDAGNHFLSTVLSQPFIPLLGVPDV